ncbi:hypothetical protein QEN19_002903 [Hanseniaspora menglaensis]
MLNILTKRTTNCSSASKQLAQNIKTPSLLRLQLIVCMVRKSSLRSNSSIVIKNPYIENVPYEKYLKATHLNCDSCGINLQFEDASKPGFNNSKKVFELDPNHKNLCVRCHNMYEYNSISNKLKNYKEDFKPFKYEDVKKLMTLTKINTLMHFVSADQFPLGFNIQLLKDHFKNSNFLLVITKADTIYSNKIKKKYYIKYFRKLLKQTYPGLDKEFDTLSIDMVTNFPTFNNETELDPMKFMKLHMPEFKLKKNEELKEGNYIFGETNSGKTVFLNNLMKLGNGFILSNFNDLKSEQKLKKISEIDKLNQLPKKKLITFGCSPLNNTTRKERFFYFEKWNIKLIDLPGFSHNKIELLTFINEKLIKLFLNNKLKKKFTPLDNTDKIQITCSKPFDPRPKTKHTQLSESELLDYRTNQIPLVSLDGLILIQPPSSGNIIIHNKATYTKPKKFQNVEHFKHTKGKYHLNPSNHPDMPQYIKTNEKLLDPNKDFQKWVIPPFKKTVDLVVESLGVVKLEWDSHSILDSARPLFIVYLPKGLNCFLRKDTESMAMAFKDFEKKTSKKTISKMASVFHNVYQEDIAVKERLGSYCYKIDSNIDDNDIFDELKSQYDKKIEENSQISLKEFLQKGKEDQLFWTNISSQ